MGGTGYLELHGADFVQGVSHVLSDHGPGDFVVTLRCGLHRVPRHVIKCNHVGEDAHGFVEGTEPVWADRGRRETRAREIFTDISPSCRFRHSGWIRRDWSLGLSSPVIRGVTVLLQEVILDKLSDFQSDFVSLSKRSLRTHRSYQKH